MRRIIMRHALFLPALVVIMQTIAGCGPGNVSKDAGGWTGEDSGAANPPDAGAVTQPPDGSVAPTPDAAGADPFDAHVDIHPPDAGTEKPDAGTDPIPPDAGIPADEPVIIPSNWRDLGPFPERFQSSGSSQSIGLAATSFDPITLIGPDGPVSTSPTAGAFPPELIREPFTTSHVDLFLVQAHSPLDLVVLREFMEGVGIKITGYVPNNAYFVWLSPQDRDELLTRREVSWLGLMQPAWRIAPKLDYLIQMESPRQLRFVALFSPELVPNAQDVVDAVTAAGFSVLEMARRSRDWKVHLEGSTANVSALVRMPECTWVERLAPLIYHNNLARSSATIITGRGVSSGPIMDVEDVWARGIRGEGQVVGIADSGLSTGDLATLHQDFGQQGNTSNPMRVIGAYAWGRPNDWSDDQSAGGGGHGTHTSGAIVGNGFRSGSTPATNAFPSTSYAGIAPKAQLYMQSTMKDDGSIYSFTDYNTLFQQAYDMGARVHSNSWGSNASGDYTAISQDVDEFTWNHKDMTILFSAGNSGKDGRVQSFICMNSGVRDGVIDTDSIDAPGTAKNAITIGASENYRPTFALEYPEGDCTTYKTWGAYSNCSYSLEPIFSDPFANNANGLGAFSGRGPTSDLRFKPDLVAPGVAIISTRTDKNQAYTQWGVCEIPSAYQNYYMAMSGTSMATPLAAGAAALVRQYYVDGWHANHSTVTNLESIPANGFTPSAALIKATLVNGAWDMSPGQFGTGATREIPPGWDTGADLPNNAEGFGRVDLEASLFPGSGYGHPQWRQMLVKDVSPGLQTGQFHAYTITVDSNASPLVVTLVWTDPWAAVGASPTLVNNIDLTAISPSNVPYYANRLNRTSGLDSRNTVEQVKVTAPEMGTWTIRVNGLNVPGNGTAGTNTQPYALVASAMMPPPCSTPSTPTGLTAVPNGYNRIDLSWTPVAAGSYRVYRSTTSGGPYTRIATDVASANFSDTVGISGGQTYYYVVSAFNSPICESGQSNQSSATALGDCGQMPTFGGLQTATAVSGGGCVVRLEWDAGTNNCGNAPLVYNVYRSEVSGFVPGPATLLADCISDTYYEDNTVVDGRTNTYYYVVRAEDQTVGGSGVCRNGNEDANTTQVAAWPVGEITSTTLYANTFESGTGMSDFTVGFFGGTTTSYWQGIQACSPYHSETHIFRFGNTSCAGNYPSRTEVWQFAEPNGATGISVPRDASNVQLSFWHSRGFNTGDGALLAISFDGQQYYLVQPGWLSGTSYNGTVTIGTSQYNAFTGSDGSMTQTVFNVDAACNAILSKGCESRTVFLAFAVYVANDRHVSTGWFLDDVMVTADAPDACGATPGPVTFLTATVGDGQSLLEWQNPPEPYGSTFIRYRTDTYPTGPTDGTLLTERAGTAGARDAFTHLNQTNGTRYYYAAFVQDASGPFSSRRMVSARPVVTSGTVKWAYATGASAMAPPGIGSVYAVSNDRVLHSMQPGPTGGMWPTGWTPFGMNGASVARPVIVPNNAGPAPKTVFVSSTDGHVYAVNGETGASVWPSPPLLGDMLVSSPAAMFTAYGGSANLVFIGTRNSTAANQLRALNVSDGSIAWSFDNGGGANGIGIISGTPVVSYSTSRVYFTSRARSGGSTKTVWALNVSAGAGTKAWENQLDVGECDAAPALKGTKLFVGNNAGKLYALNSVDGTNAWSGGGPYDTADGPVKDYLWVTNSEIIFSTTTKVWAITDNGDHPTLLWQVSTIASPSPPLVVQSAKHAIVGSSDGNLYKISYASLPPTVTQVQLGDGLAAVGSPAMDGAQNLIHVGTEAGDVHAVSYLSMP